MPWPRGLPRARSRPGRPSVLARFPAFNVCTEGHQEATRRGKLAKRQQVTQSPPRMGMAPARAGTTRTNGRSTAFQQPPDVGGLPDVLEVVVGHADEARRQGDRRVVGTV